MIFFWVVGWLEIPKQFLSGAGTSKKYLAQEISFIKQSIYWKEIGVVQQVGGNFLWSTSSRSRRLKIKIKEK